jgi:hypothetical protein
MSFINFKVLQPGAASLSESNNFNSGHMPGSLSIALISESDTSFQTPNVSYAVLPTNNSISAHGKRLVAMTQKGNQVGDVDHEMVNGISLCLELKITKILGL